MSNLTYSYIAGLFDGEGSIFVDARKEKKDQTVAFLLRAVIVNTNIKPLNAIHSIFGGHVNLIKNREYSLGKKPCYSFEIDSKKCEKFLRAIYPFLIIKKEKARIALISRSLLMNKLHINPNSRKPDELINLLYKIKKKASQL